MTPLVEFWIDVGGTFTDCLMKSSDGTLSTYKVLSSGITKGRATEFVGERQFRDQARVGDSPAFWRGYSLTLLDESGASVLSCRVLDFDALTGTFTLDADCSTLMPNLLGEPTAFRDHALPIAKRPGSIGNYELSSGEEAPILAIRTALGLRLEETIPTAIVRLGTTRGTNALLTRRGAKVGFIITKGFRDVLLIANQDRPRLFDLAIQKPEPLFSVVTEIDERLDSLGAVLTTPREAEVRDQIRALKFAGCESLAICLLHAFANPVHELLVEQIARDEGFTEISTSSRLSPLIKIVSRGDTTVMDAYVNPILRDYVGKLLGALGTANSGNVAGITAPHTLKLMTSSGGLVDAARFTGKDSVLSGPAGGVIGFSRVAQRAGFAKSIGFDMGGTSTDVSRFDGRFEREFETIKAGVRVVAPMLAIETVAAGGGSVCGFDGVKLFVGPQSAGANPGPACYGRGGPLTITDVNLFLGKIIPERFPFPLDHSAVETRLFELCERVMDSPLGRRYSEHELAQGFIDIANTTMARAIRKISVSKGYDPAEYALVTFGGAGAQHACALVQSLGMKTVLSHPYSGIMSAYGIGLADVRQLNEQGVLQPYSPELLSALESDFVRMATSATEAVLAEGISADRIDTPIRSLDIRYQGIEASLNVIQPSDGNFAAAYATRHQQLYGYTRPDRALEVVAARIEVVGRQPDPVENSAAETARVPEPHSWTETWFHGSPHPTAVFLREQLHPGDTFNGPAILCEPTSTVVIDPGFEAVILGRGEIVITIRSDASNATSERGSREMPIDRQPLSLAKEPPAADPIRIEIFNHLFASIAEQMGIALQQTSLSTNVKERLDFSCGIFSAQGELVVNAPHIPVHLGAMSETVRRIIEDNPTLKSGDVFVTNDPYRGGSHLPDVTVITPVHEETTGELMFFTASRAHHAEIGGIVPGSMPPFSKTLADEGVLIRNFLLVDGGRSRDSELRTLLQSGPYPSRSVGDNLADVSAQVAANRTGASQLQRLVESQTWHVVRAFMCHIQASAAAKMRLALEELSRDSSAWSRSPEPANNMPRTVAEVGPPACLTNAEAVNHNVSQHSQSLAQQSAGHLPIANRQFTCTDCLDDGSPICVTITISAGHATVDFTGTGPVLATNLNANRAIVTAAVLYVFRCLIKDEIPLNSGVLDPVTIILPSCLLNPPSHDDPRQCAAMVGGNVETSQRVVDVLLGALGVAAASQGTMNNLTFGDETFGYYETICGGSGATRDADGADAVHTHMTNTRLTDPEVIERRYPVRIHEFSIRPNSGGIGNHRGGDGIVRKIEFLKPLRVSILSERRGQFPPFGLQGGGAGQLGRNTLRRAGATNIDALAGKVSLDVQAGDVLTIETPGGGGFGLSVT
jgi:5-oxoprolinase (ATP-hydrolysing)